MKYLSTVIAVLLVALFVFNVGNVLDYEESVVEASAPALEQPIVEGVEVATNKYDNLKSIKDIPISGNLESSPINFASPENETIDGKEITEEDNKKMFFFGTTDFGNDDFGNWNEWESTTETSSGGTTETSQPSSMEPIEVSLDKFLNR